MVSRSGLWLAVLATATLISASIIVALRHPRAPARGARAFALLLSLAAGALAFGAKLGTLRSFGWQHPFFDQWVEGRGLYQPFLEARLPWANLFQPHNEHRVFFTRLLALALFDINRQWDNQVQATACALLHTLSLVWLVFAFARRLGRAEAFLLTAVVLSFLALPLARENVVWGFQSQFYFLELFAPLAIWLLTQAPARPLARVLGALCCAACLIAVGSGPLCAVAVILAAALSIWRFPALAGQQLPVLLTGGAVSAIGLFFRLRVQAPLGAQTLHFFFQSMMRTLSYPLIDDRWPALLLWLPLLVLLGLWLAKRGVPAGEELFALGLGAFAAMHAPAIGYARGASGAAPATRYFDLLALGAIANALAAVLLVRRARATGSPLHPARALLAAWICLAGVGGLGLLRRMLGTELPLVGAAVARQEKAMALYVRTGDAGLLRHDAPGDLSYPDERFLEEELALPFVRSVLPVALRVPLRLEPAGPTPFSGSSLPGDEEPPPVQPVYSDLGKFSGGGSGPFESRPIHPTLPYLRFALTGYFLGEGESLSLEGNERVDVSLPESPGAGWTALRVRRPEGAFRVVARDARPDAWFAFTAPVEEGWLSALAELARERWWLVLSLGVALALLPIAWTLSVAFQGPPDGRGP